MTANDVQIFIFGAEVDLDSLIEEVGSDWRAIFTELATELDIAFVMLDGTEEPISTQFSIVLNGEAVDLEALGARPGYDWRPVIARLAPRLVAALPGSWWPCDPADIDAFLAPPPLPTGRRWVDEPVPAGHDLI